VQLVRDFWRILRSDRLAFIGAVIIAIYVLVAIVAPEVVHLSGVQHPGKAFELPSLSDLLGTDFAGHSVLKEILIGSRPVLVVAFLAATFTMAIGVVLGLLTAYIGGSFDSVVMRIADVVLTIPGTPLILVLAAYVRASNPIILAGILSVTGWAGLARSVRSQAMSVARLEYIEAARVQGLSTWNIISRQMFPNLGPYIAIHFLLDMSGAIYNEVGLFLLGIAPFTVTNWGVMLSFAMSEGALYVARSASYVLSPMIAIILFQVALVFFARALDQLFNPRLRYQ